MEIKTSDEARELNDFWSKVIGVRPHSRSDDLSEEVL